MFRLHKFLKLRCTIISFSYFELNILSHLYLLFHIYIYIYIHNWYMNVYILTYKFTMKKKERRKRWNRKYGKNQNPFFFVTCVSWTADDLMILLTNQFLLGVKFETQLRPKIMVLKVEQFIGRKGPSFLRCNLDWNRIKSWWCHNYFNNCFKYI